MTRLGVCSWSLRARTPAELAERVSAAGVRHLQLALDPLRRRQWDRAEVQREFVRSGLTVLSGMWSPAGEDYSTLESIARTGGIRPDATWPENLAAAASNARLARDLGLSLVTFHGGFLPASPDDPERARIVDRLRQVIDTFAAQQVAVALETGQEHSADLARLLEELDCPTVGVNFDPANLLLYGRDEPLLALERLAPWVRQVHIKDARRTELPGTWGSEVRAGQGQVPWAQFFRALCDEGFSGDLVIEREAGERRVEDVRAARDLVRQLWPAEIDG
jgi:L-ribulose-5-phosphate 3-epimerase